MLNCIYFIERFIKYIKGYTPNNGLKILFLTVTYRIIQVTVMSHSRDDNRKKELKKNKKNGVSLCFKGIIITVNIK